MSSEETEHVSLMKVTRRVKNLKRIEKAWFPVS
jgi:hypothetical protein